MKILHVIQRYFPYVGGSEGYFKEISERFVRDGHEVDVFTTDAWDLEHFWAARKRRVDERDGWVNSVRVRRFPVRHVPFSRLAYPIQRRLMAEVSALPFDTSSLLRFACQNMPLVPGLGRELAKDAGRYDLVHATNVPFDSLLYSAYRFARVRGIPLVITPFTHLGEPGNDGVRKYYSMQHQVAMMRDAGAVIVQTDLERHFLAGKGVPVAKMHKVGVGVNPEEVAGGVAERLRSRLRISGPIAFSLGTMAYDKGTNHTVEAVRALWRRGVDVDLVLAGPTMGHFVRHVEGLPEAERRRCHLLGFVTDETKRDLLAAGDVFVMPSRTDSFGIVYLEAWLYGKPVIGAQAGGVPEVIEDGIDGYLVPFGDVEAIATRMKTLLTNRELAGRFGEAGRRRVLARHTWDMKYASIAGIYEQLAGSRSGQA